VILLQFFEAFVAKRVQRKKQTPATILLKKKLKQYHLKCMKSDIDFVFYQLLSDTALTAESGAKEYGSRDQVAG